MGGLRVFRRILLAASVCVAAIPTVSAQEGAKPVPFGRYDLVFGQDNPMCLAVGEQIKDYKHIDFVPSEKRKGYFGVSPEVLKALDMRCDFPLHSKGKLEVPVWSDIDIFANRENYFRLLHLYAYFSDTGVNQALSNANIYDKGFGIVIDAQLDLIDLLAERGIMQYQRAYIKNNNIGLVYRVSLPKNTNDNKCWFLAYDKESPLFKTKTFEYQQREMFFYNGVGFVLVDAVNDEPGESPVHSRGKISERSEGKDISIVPLQLFLSATDKSFGPKSRGILSGLSCGFLLNRS